ncbi:peptidoglycan-binding domain-containing protein [Bartonella birtlesii]|uniref:peptidoglycan-binding domain-containing protein n=1 Tax=Bartonella birtlesii TaxID=111504 RepID=UPI000421CC12|nr:peptidoglycan-binding protein [Bartonella birtlesii]
MTKRRKMRKTKNAKKRKYYSSLVISFFLISSCFLFWIVKTLYFYTRKNTFFLGAFLFIISLGFVSFNALFSQMTMHQGSFTKMKFIFPPELKQNSTLSEKKAISHPISHIPFIPSSNKLHKNSSSHSLSKNTLEMQNKLAKLGFYDGPLDGIEGPKTRRAIALWKQQTAQEMQNSTLSNTTADEIAILIQQSEIKIANETKDTPHSVKTVLNPPVADIIQVQKALRIFGNQEVIVTGVEDQKTIEALKQFQKMFNLPITGKIDHIVLVKMREIGLLN